MTKPNQMLSAQNDQMLKTEHYRYRLGANAWTFYKKKEKDRKPFSVNIENVILSSNEWAIFRSKQEKLHHLVQSDENPTGIIDCQIFIPATGVVVRDFKSKPKKKMKSSYTLEEITTMSREEIMQVCKQLDIPYVNRTTEVLKKDILKASMLSKKTARKKS